MTTSEQARKRTLVELSAMRTNLARANADKDKADENIDRIERAITKARANCLLTSGVLRTVKWKLATAGSTAYGIECTEPEKLLQALPEVFDDSDMPWIDLTSDGQVKIYAQDCYVDVQRSARRADVKRVTLTIRKDMPPADIAKWLHLSGIGVDVTAIDREVATLDSLIEAKNREIQCLRAIAAQFRESSP